MTTTEVRGDGATSDESTGTVDMKLEVVTISVSDVDRATPGSAHTTTRLPGRAHELEER